MNPPQFVNNFANPVFMASMAPGCPLGTLITSASEFMEAVPGTDAVEVGGIVTDLGNACPYDSVMAQIYAETVQGAGTDVTGFRQAQERFQDRARPFFDEHIGALARDVARGEAGIPVYRPGGVDIIDAGFRAVGLRKLMDLGLASPAIVQGLVSALETNLDQNREGLGESWDDNPLALGIFGGPSMLLSAMANATMTMDPTRYPFPELILPITASAFLAAGLGIYMVGGFKNLTPSHRRAIGAPFVWNRLGKLKTHERTMRRLRGEYRLAFDRVDWTTRLVPGTPPASVPPPATGGAKT